MTAIALTIAGSDSGGGAGIQADLKTFAFHRVHGTSALTCVTAQNTLGVERVESLSPEMVTAQIDAVVGDLSVSAVKTGMLFSSEIIEAVAEAIERWRLISLVVDPVMVSRVGAKLIDDRAVDSLFDSLIPLASIITPNRYEAQLLSGIEINDFEAVYFLIVRENNKTISAPNFILGFLLRVAGLGLNVRTFQTVNRTKRSLGNLLGHPSPCKTKLHFLLEITPGFLKTPD